MIERRNEHDVHVLLPSVFPPLCERLAVPSAHSVLSAPPPAGFPAPGGSHGDGLVGVGLHLSVLEGPVAELAEVACSQVRLL